MKKIHVHTAHMASRDIERFLDYRRSLPGVPIRDIVDIWNRKSAKTIYQHVYLTEEKHADLEG